MQDLPGATFLSLAARVESRAMSHRGERHHQADSFGRAPIKLFSPKLLRVGARFLPSTWLAVKPKRCGKAEKGYIMPATSRISRLQPMGERVLLSDRHGSSRQRFGLGRWATGSR